MLNKWKKINPKILNSFHLNYELTLIALGIFIGASLELGMALHIRDIETKEWQTQAISLGHASINPKTKEFQWNP